MLDNEKELIYSGDFNLEVGDTKHQIMSKFEASNKKKQEVSKSEAKPVASDAPVEGMEAQFRS